MLNLFMIKFLLPSLVRFCQSCLQECLRPQKPVCAVCRASLGHWTKAAELEALIQSSVAACKGCGAQVWLWKLTRCPACLCWVGFGYMGVIIKTDKLEFGKNNQYSFNFEMLCICWHNLETNSNVSMQSFWFNMINVQMCVIATKQNRAFILKVSEPAKCSRWHTSVYVTYTKT